MSEIEETKEKPTGISFVITGFGPFRGVAKNPSTVLVQELQSYLESHDEAELATRIQQCLVLETSAQDVRAKIDEISLQPSDSTVTIFLHLGVNYKGTGFQLEKCAWNDATFRVPDEQGFQPRNKPILDDTQLPERCDTHIDIETLAQNQTEVHSSIESKCSIDPGRFVCNYLYFYSMNKLQSTSRICMFLHVPPFAVVEKDAQLAYVSSLLKKMFDLYMTKESYRLEEQ
jgi:pyroglutamyl-peptidase